MLAGKHGLRFCILIIIAAIFVFVGQIGATHVHAANDDYDTMRIRCKNFLTGGTGYDTSDHLVYLSKIYKEITGLNLSEYILHARMEEAKKLLENTSYKIYEITERLAIRVHSISLGDSRNIMA